MALHMTRSRSDAFSETLVIRPRGRLLARAVAVFFAVALLAEAFHVALAGEPAAREAPDFALKSAAGPNLRLSEFRSDVVAVAFWASWCGACRAELGKLQALQDDLGPGGLRVLAVSFDEDAGVARETAAAERVSFPVLLDADGEVGELYDVSDLPTVVLVDRAGGVRGVFEGSRAVARAPLADDVRALLAE